MVQSAKEGSMIFDWIAPILPVANDLFNAVETFNPILEFGNYIKGFFNDLKEGKETKLKKKIINIFKTHLEILVIIANKILKFII